MLDADLVLSVKNNGCSGCFCKLTSMHSGLFYKMCSRYVQAIKSCGISREDVLDNRNFVFLDSIYTFNPSLGVKFSTWLANKTRFYCLNLISSRKRIVNFSNDQIKDIIEKKAFYQLEDKKKTEDISYVMFLLDGLKDKRIKQVFKLRYLEGSRNMRWRNIADTLLISVQTAINLHSRGVKILSGKINSREIFDSV